MSRERGPARRPDRGTARAAVASPEAAAADDIAAHAMRVRTHYLPLIARHGDSYRTVDWASPQLQRLRFGVLAGSGLLEGGSVLDVGCGVGHFLDYLIERGFEGDYAGVDLLPEMLERARARHPGRKFIPADVLGDDSPLAADWVVANGIFHLCDQALMRRMIERCFARCRHGLALTSLSAWSAVHDPAHFLYADPLETAAWARRLTSRLVLRTDYLPHDFALYLYRDR